LALSRLIRRSGLRESVSAQLLCLLLFIADCEETGEGGIRTLGENNGDFSGVMFSAIICFNCGSRAGSKNDPQSD
jgi:hypothetical protein